MASIVEFILNSEHYCVPTESVREVLPPQRIVPVPNMPRHMLGITNVRGQVVPVLDLRKRLGFPPSAKPEEFQIILVQQENQVCGLVVDQVLSVRAVSDEPESLQTFVSNEYVKGLYKQEDRLTLVLDLSKIL